MTYRTNTRDNRLAQRKCQKSMNRNGVEDHDSDSLYLSAREKMPCVLRHCLTLSQCNLLSPQKPALRAYFLGHTVHTAESLHPPPHVDPAPLPVIPLFGASTFSLFLGKEDT